jgi:hypothetical protein
MLGSPWLTGLNYGHESPRTTSAPAGAAALLPGDRARHRLRRTRFPPRPAACGRRSSADPRSARRRRPRHLGAHVRTATSSVTCRRRSSSGSRRGCCAAAGTARAVRVSGADTPSWRRVLLEVELDSARSWTRPWPGVEQFVFVSFSGNLSLPTPLHDSKRQVEQRLQQSPMTWTILRPSAFMEVWLSPASGSMFPRASSPCTAAAARRSATSRSSMSRASASKRCATLPPPIASSRSADRTR